MLTGSKKTTYNLWRVRLWFDGYNVAKHKYKFSRQYRRQYSLKYKYPIRTTARHCHTNKDT
jgi:hypothetical protein